MPKEKQSWVDLNGPKGFDLLVSEASRYFAAETARERRRPDRSMRMSGTSSSLS
jgi:hypothetical protein